MDLAPGLAGITCACGVDIRIVDRGQFYLTNSGSSAKLYFHRELFRFERRGIRDCIGLGIRLCIAALGRGL